MTNQLYASPPRAFDRNGEPLAGAKAYIYQSGTMTAVTVTDFGGTPLAWPVIADLNGTFAQMFYDGSFDLKLIITDSADAVQPGYPVDPVGLTQGGASSAASITFVPTPEAPSLDVQGALEDLSDAVGTLEARTITGAGLATGGGALTANRVITVAAATLVEAEAGVSTSVTMTPLRVAQAIVALSPLGVSFTSADQTITSGALLTLAHGMVRTPELLSLYLVCQVIEEGWAVADAILTGTIGTTTSTNRATAVYADATNVYVRFSNAANCFLIGNKATGAAATATNANWKLRVRAWA